jgi:hypothetical protein
MAKINVKMALLIVNKKQIWQYFQNSEVYFYLI